MVPEQMVTPRIDGSLPGGPREEMARREVGHTAVRPATARAVVAIFLAAVFALPVVEWAGARARAAEGLAGAWWHLAALPRQVAARLTGADPLVAGAGAWVRTVSANRAVLAGFSAFETALEDESIVGRTLRPPAQLVMSGALGAGNERVYIGREGWLFYRPDVEYVTGRPFLSERQLARRVAAAREWAEPPQPDPRPAIAQFHRDLEARGITLVVVPTPVKATIHPAGLAGTYERAAGAVQNPSFDAFVEDLRREGVLVFDPSDLLVEERRPASPQYLATDTHWRPEAMELVAERLAAFVSAHVPLPEVADPGYRPDRREVTGTGDIALMLDLPGVQTLYPPETVWVRRVLAADGTPWRPARPADVLLLGDSFTNIYSLGTMGWGDAAGLGEQLSYVLRRPVDRIVQNDEGAFATRALLSRELAAGRDRLAGTKVVIYQFATRELTFGDWRRIELGH